MFMDFNVSIKLCLHLGNIPVNYVLFETKDYLELRRYTYERLDGSVRAEERFGVIRSFSQQPVKGILTSPDDPHGAFVFLISTRAGGVGLNLIGADTVSNRKTS